MNLHKHLWELRDGEIHINRLYWFTQPWVTSSPHNNLWEFHYVINHRLQQHTTKRWLWISQSLLTLFAPTHTSSHNHTDFTNTFSISKYNYKKLRKGRKHLELQKTRSLMTSYWTTVKLKSNLAKLGKLLSQTVCNLFFFFYLKSDCKTSI